jgi:hypothetical protein
MMEEKMVPDAVMFPVTENAAAFCRLKGITEMRGGAFKVIFSFTVAGFNCFSISPATEYILILKAL